MLTRCNDTDLFITLPTLFTCSPGLLMFFLYWCEILVFEWLFLSVLLLFMWVNGASDCSGLSHMQLCLLVGLGETAPWGPKIRLEWGDGKEPVNSDFSGGTFLFFTRRLTGEIVH